MSGSRRLAIVLSLLWVAVWLLMYSMDPVFRLGPFVVIGVGPVALAWGLWWIVAGFRRDRAERRLKEGAMDAKRPAPKVWALAEHPGHYVYATTPNQALPSGLAGGGFNEAELVAELSAIRAVAVWIEQDAVRDALRDALTAAGIQIMQEGPVT
jgi:hypothetical protein